MQQLAKAGPEALGKNGNASGAQIVLSVLRAEGVDTVWGYPGGAVLPLYDALQETVDITHLLVRHEQAAVHAADGFARATGKVGVALVTSGPGVTNTVTGIATAYFDSIPMVVISGNVPTHSIGTDAFQECDAVGITRSIVKHNFLVLDISQLAKTLKSAFYIARTGRPGPVLVDIPKDVLQAKTPLSIAESVALRSYRPRTEPHVGQVRRAAEALARSRRPCILVGGGAVASAASEEIAELVRRLDAPVTNTLMALGAFPASDRRCLGMPGLHGTYEANLAMQHCDVLIALGARFDDRVIGNTGEFQSDRRTIIHVDIDPATIDKRVQVDIPIVGDVKTAARAILEQLRAQRINDGNRNDWWKEIGNWREKRCLAYEPDADVIKPQFVIQQLWEATGGDAYICSDVGQHQMWAAQLYGFDKPRRWINSGGLGTMGVGLPYAMGVKRALPDADVVAVTGDGSIQMCIQELSTCRQYDLGVKIVSLNNGYLGMVRQLQHVNYRDRYSHSYMDALPDFVALARAYGHVGFRIERPCDVEPVLREALAMKQRTVFMDFAIDPSENVWPMVRAGAGLTDMLMNSRDVDR
ncbi:biosynthetic-type acetolactate synthase large subunit [Paraburkholderia caribensis]|nr:MULTISPECIES: biosynthetic-type acetolactate synthase large subunit [Paraburkholderia]MCO4879404.1 biosynthetic-type acetolactate synthase large subunit [Paraburkholderia caribensis]